MYITIYVHCYWIIKPLKTKQDLFCYVHTHTWALLIRRFLTKEFCSSLSFSCDLIIPWKTAHCLSNQFNVIFRQHFALFNNQNFLGVGCYLLTRNSPLFQEIAQQVHVNNEIQTSYIHICTICVHGFPWMSLCTNWQFWDTSECMTYDEWWSRLVQSKKNERGFTPNLAYNVIYKITKCYFRE